MRIHNKCPITIVTGFLGSGKTTLLSNLLKSSEFNNAVAIINEFGKAGLDHRLIRRIEERTKLLSGGCVCCNMREDLVNELKSLLDEYQKGEILMDRVVIETTGLADPAPILFSVLTDPLLIHHYFIDFVVTCLDASNGNLHLNNNPESTKQIVVADKIIITKTDITDKETLEQLQDWIRRLNPTAPILTSVMGHVDAASVLADNSGKIINVDAEDKLNSAKAAGIKFEGEHTPSIQSIAIKFDKPIDWVAFALWMSMLLHAHGENMFRIKGIVDVGDEGPVVINGVQHIIHPPQHLRNWNGEEKNSQIVFIMKNIEPHQILDSLKTFQHMIGANPEIQEINMDLSAKEG